MRVAIADYLPSAKYAADLLVLLVIAFGCLLTLVITLNFDSPEVSRYF